MNTAIKKIARSARRFSTEVVETTDHLDTWIKINREMRNEAREIVNSAIESRVSQINHDIEGIKIDIHGIKPDFLNIKSDIKEMSNRINRIEGSIAELYKHNTNSTRLILMGIFGTASAAVGINQYFENERAKLQDGNEKKSHAK